MINNNYHLIIKMKKLQIKYHAGGEKWSEYRIMSVE